MTRNQRLKTFHKRSIREEDSDESDNELDSSSNYKIEFKPLSLEEKEEKEEQQLLSLINQLKNNPKLNSSNEDNMLVTFNIAPYNLINSFCSASLCINSPGTNFEVNFSTKDL